MKAKEGKGGWGEGNGWDWGRCTLTSNNGYVLWWEHERIAKLILLVNRKTFGSETSELIRFSLDNFLEHKYVVTERLAVSCGRLFKHAIMSEVH